jgi:IclR family pca regulon transcriptional regulator
MGRVMLAFATDDALDAYLGRVALEPITPHTLVDPAALRDELGRIRERGWALVDQELEIGLRSLAAPVFNPRGEAIAAVNVSTTSASSGRFDDDELARRLLATAAAIGDDLRLARPEMADEPQRWGAPTP